MKMSGARIVCRSLEDAGVRFTFGIPGTHNIELYDAMIESDRLQPILVTDEQCASFMADGVARASGELAALNLVPGAGLTHALSGIAEAFLDQTPMLVLSCGLREDTGAAFQLHDVDQCAIATPVCKKVFKAHTHQELYRLIREACTLARLAPAGPVMIEIPANLYLFIGGIDEQALQYDEDSTIETYKTSPSEHNLHAIVQALNESQSIAIYAGIGTQQARVQLIELADRLDAIVFTTISAKGVFPEDHPRWAWNTMGAAAPTPIRQLEKNFDCLLAIGCRFGEVATASYGFKPPSRLLHIDINPEVFNKNYPAEVTWTSEATEALSSLLTTTELKAKPRNENRLKTLRAAHEAVKNEQAGATSHNRRVSPVKLLDALDKEFGPESLYVADSGNGTFLAMELLRLTRARSFLAPTDYSCMGYSVPAAIGAKLASPDRPVVALAGDGAFLMTGLELLTAATYGIGPVICVLNDGKLSQIAQFQKASLNRETCTSLPSLDFKAFSAALHLEYLEIETDGDIADRLAAARRLSQQGKPVLVNVRIDYSAPTYFSRGVIKTNFLRFPWRDRARLIGRVLKRKIL